ncbi:chemotaxis protein CheW [archaeon]|nr:chemotaxis protein CheW [archaeon]
MLEADEIVGAEVQLVVFRLASEEYCVDIQQVREIIKVQDITKVPKAPKFIEGVINLRGQITPILDLRRRLDLPETEWGEDTRIIVTELEKNIVGMIVDAVMEVNRLPEKDIDPTPTISTEVGSEFIKGVGKLGDRLLILLDLQKVLSKNEEKELEKI